MKILVCGGDERSVYLAGMLAAEGHEVLVLRLDRAEPPRGCIPVAQPERADAVILPVPAENERGMLNAPLGSEPMVVEHILERAGSGAIIIGGKLSPRLRREVEARGMEARDYMRSAEYAAENAAVTAEGAVYELMKSSEAALRDMKILVIGWGRIGKLLIKKLGALCPSVTLMSANPTSRAVCSALGCPSIAPDAPKERLTCFDAVINTAPAPVLPSLAALKESCLLLELASAPGGLDGEVAEAEGLELVTARGLPGKYAPFSAARAMLGAVNEILKERVEA